MQGLLLKGFDPANDQRGLVWSSDAELTGTGSWSDDVRQLKEPLVCSQVSHFAGQAGPCLGEKVRERRRSQHAGNRPPMFAQIVDEQGGSLTESIYLIARDDQPERWCHHCRQEQFSLIFNRCQIVSSLDTLREFVQVQRDTKL